MKRRSFLQTSLATLGTAAAASTGTAAGPQPGEVYELRTYVVKPGKQAVLDQYLRRAFIPAAKRAGAGPVGVFVDTKNEAQVVVVVVAPSADQLAALPGRLADDAEYRTAAADYLAVPATAPVYSRIETSLLVPIAGMPRLARPDATKPRLFNLRMYESHNERAAAKKIEMFNTGELAIFRRVGLTPVFFASTVVGRSMPNLTYMLVFPDDAGRNAAWGKFRKDAEWNKLKAIPEYADTEIVSNITNTILKPTAYSEI
jgi:hypothetical protein